MGSRIWMWKNIPGIPGRCNDVLYTLPMSQPTRDILVFFGGDVQVRETKNKWQLILITWFIINHNVFSFFLYLLAVGWKHL